MTIWQKLTGKHTDKISTPIATASAGKRSGPISPEMDPLNLKIGANIQIKTVDLEDLNFKVTKKRYVATENPEFAFDIQTDSDQLIKKRLWLAPAKNKTNLILLNYVAGGDWGAEYENSLNDNETAQEGDDIFWRVGDVKTPWEVNTQTSTEDKTQQGSVKYWDFWRETVVEGQTVTEFYIVELSDFYYDVWRGFQLEPERLKVT